MASKSWPTFMTTSATWPRPSSIATPRPPAPVALSTRSSVMSKLDFMPECFAPDPWAHLSGWTARRRRLHRWGVVFHKDPAHGHDHGHDYMGQPGTARYAGSKRRVYTIGVAGPVGSGKTALVEMLCRAL